MMIIITGYLLAVVIVYLFISVHYQLGLAIVYFSFDEPRLKVLSKDIRYAIIVPAHNEEILIERLCENLLVIDYPSSLREIFILVDNCNDATESICRSYPVNVMVRNDPTRIGKGFALQWALEQIELNAFDAVFVLDADTTVDRSILKELAKLVLNGSNAIQCYIAVPNRHESWLTQLMHLSRTVNNLYFHCAKYKLGLSSYLMGTGMCFRSSILLENKWTAVSLSEDWEYFAQLIEKGITIDFAVNGIVHQRESRSLKQATTQRLRWSKGRFQVARDLGFGLLVKGLRNKDFSVVDASLSLLLPNWSLLVNLLVVLLILSLSLPLGHFRWLYVGVSCEMIGIQVLIISTGVMLCGEPWNVLKAIMVSPVFLVWKFIIDFLSISGIYRGKKWVRTERHLPE